MIKNAKTKTLEENTHTTKRKILRNLLLLGGLAAVAFVAIGAYLYTHQEQIKQVVLTQINHVLEAEVQVEDIQLDLFSTFPKISVRFENVQCKEVIPFPKENLFAFKNIYASMNVWDLLMQDYSISEILLDDGEIHIKQFKDGSDNFHFWKKSTDSNSVDLALESVALSQTKFIYEDAASDVVIKLFTKKLALKGSLWKSVFEADFSLKGSDFSLHTEGLDIFHKIDVMAKSKMSVSDGEIQFNEGHLGLAKLVFDLNGKVQNKNSEWNISGSKMSLAHFISMIPSYWLPLKSQMLADGDFNTTTNVKIQDSKVYVNTDFSIENGKYKNLDYPLELSNVSVDGQFTNGKGLLQNTKLHLENFKGKTQTGSFFCDIDIHNFKSPRITVNGELNMNAPELMAIIRPGVFSETNGTLSAQFTAQSQYNSFSDIQQTALRNARFSGKMQFKEGVLQFKDANFKLKDIDGELAFNGKNINISKLEFSSGNSQLKAKGALKNVIYFTEDRPTPILNLHLMASSLDLYEIAHWNFGEVKEGSNNNIPFEFRTTWDVEQFNWKTFTGSDLLVNVIGDEHHIIGNVKRLRTNNGQITGDFSIDKAAKNLHIESEIANVDIHSLFEQFNNFGQEDIVSHNIYGDLSTSLQLNLGFDDHWEIIPDQIKVKSKFELNNGKLVDYAPLLSMSKYADEEDLKNVQFSTLQNTLTIEHSVITIPMMSIASNALNLDIEGTHDFNSNIDYHIRMQLSLALKGKKKKKTGLEDWIVEDERPDEPYIWVKVGCTVADPCVGLDKSKVGKDIIKSVTNEGEDWKNIKNEPIKKEDPNEGEMIFEWEEK